MRPADERYFERLEAELETAVDVAGRAREAGGDPVADVEIPVARDMADRVENILGIDGVAERVRELDGQMSREEAALELVEDFVEGTVGDYDSRAGKVEGAVRTAVALLTEGVVAAPIEGIDRVELLTDDDGSEFINVYYAGPIRSAGGTAQALSVLVADYARTLLGVDQYRAQPDEVGRYAEEVGLYDDETGLQYSPKEAETEFIADHMPIMLDGEATGDEEVSGHRDLDRVNTNAARGGMCLVLAEGIALKAPKIQRYTRELEEVAWPWLQDLIDGTYASATGVDGPVDDDGANAESTVDDGLDDGVEDATEGGGSDEAEETEQPAGPPRVEPTEKYLRDLIAGRPVFSHPSMSGGFRLRYGRARNHGFATAGVHPATMHLVDDFLATGTQIKTERPGKAAGVVPVDSIEGPTVRLASGEVRRVDDPAEAREIRNGVAEVLDLGEYLVNYGEFVENNHPLAPAAYTVEWWRQEFAAAGGPRQALEDSVDVDLENPEPDRALEWASAYDAPLHPDFTYLWHDVVPGDVFALAAAIEAGSLVATDGSTLDPGEGGERGKDTPDPSNADLALPPSEQVSRTLERLLVEHTRSDGTLVVETWRPLVRTLGFDDRLDREWGPDDVSEYARSYGGGENAIEVVNEVAPFAVRERAPTRIGNRMGRPEKSEERELSPAVHTLFPIGEAGGDERKVGKAATSGDAIDGTKGAVTVEVGRRACVDCGTRTWRPRCPECNGETRAVYRCPDCDREVEVGPDGPAECPRCETRAWSTHKETVDVGAELEAALASVHARPTDYEVLKGVKGLSSKAKTPEPLEKGILRAKHDVSTFKDGTVRYDMTDLPVTAVRPSELDVTAEDLQELGYEIDVHGEPLRHDDQLVSLKVQDVVLSDGAAEHMLRTADFVDELLAEYYGLEPYYELEDREDLVGELVFGMAPHTSAAVVGRVVGFTTAAVGYAHPYFHASKRRNCFHPETKIWVQDESGDWLHQQIQEVIEPRLTEPRRDDFGTQIQDLEQDIHVPSLTEDGALVRKRVQSLSKHVAPSHMVKIETRSGRELEVTPDHRIQVVQEGSLAEKRAAEVCETDSVVTPNHLEVVDPTGESAQFDLLEEFVQLDTVDTERLMVIGMGKRTLYDLFERALADEWEGRFYPLQSTAAYLDMSHKTLSNYLYRERIPASILLEFLESTEALCEFVPEDVKLGMKRDTAEIHRMITLDERVATVIGYYAAEGFAREQATPKGTIHQTTLCGTESEAREFYLEVLSREFGVDPYAENDAKITVSGRLLRAFFDSVLEAGIFAHTKRVPDCIFGAPDETVSAFLRGYFSGDGNVSSSSLVVETTTVSPELKEDLFALLKRLGIVSRADIREPVPLHEKFSEYYDEGDAERSSWSYVLRITSEDAVRFAEEVGFHLSRKQSVLESQVESVPYQGRRAFDGGKRDYLVETVDSVRYLEPNIDATYCLTVESTHSLVANDTVQKQCDGDEDCVMLLLDGLLNFSKQYLPDQRGGRMDAPLVMSSRIDPTEIDDEAHNMDVVREYPREFYEATREMADPEAVADVMTLAEDTLGTDREYAGFDHTHDTSNIAAGPALSAYKTLGPMQEKMDAQLELSRRLRAVDETDVAERIIEYHFLPDIIGNLRAFSRQEVRCLSCGEKYRRMPLTGTCRECGGDVNLTVHEGSVTKYMATAKRVAEEFGAREYTKQRLEILDRRIERIFEDDQNKQSGIADFM
ncbi:MAG: DNA polymerase II large subunit [Haloarculaceae archaeon]